MIQRKGMIVYFENKEILDRIDKNLCHIYYVSEKNKYAVLYCDSNRYKGISQFVEKLPGVTKVEESLLGVEENNF